MTRDFAASEYAAAAAYAREQATLHRLDVALRNVVWYGRRRIVVSFACRNDSDYARAEIIRPGEPQSK